VHKSEVKPNKNDVRDAEPIWKTKWKTAGYQPGDIARTRAD